MTQCPKCNQYFMTEDGDQDNNPNEKGLDGKPLGAKEKQHKLKWRFRCSECQTIFCGSCHAAPYHLGYTCETWKSYQQAKKCRFCEKQLKADNMAQPESNAGAGVTNVCNDPECLKKRQYSCDKINPCGHNCIGMRGEKKMSCMFAS